MSPFAQPAEIDCTIGAALAQLVKQCNAWRTLRNSRNPLLVRFAPLAAVSSLMLGCGTDKGAKTPTGPVDEWANLSRGPEWLHVTSGFSGAHKEECALIQKWVLGDSGCKASACEHARDLARD